MQIEIIDPDPQADISLFEQIVIDVFTREHKAAEYVNVVFMEHDALRALKNEYFSKDVYTDVITFNLNESDDPLEGEIYLSFKQIELNAIKYKTAAQTELHRVLIHGCLHLCGYEDETVELKTQMTTLEDHYLQLIKHTVS